MTNHTPGPWVIRKAKENGACSVVSESKDLAGFTFIAALAPSDEATARLIAAAPDLLGALQEYVRLFEDHCITNPSAEDKDFTGYLAELARAAIKKATGEE